MNGHNDARIADLRSQFSHRIEDKAKWKGMPVAEFYKVNRNVVLELLACFPKVNWNGLLILSGIRSQGNMPFVKEYLSGQLFQEITGRRITLLPRYTNDILNQVFEISLNTGSTGDAFYVLDNEGRIVDFKLGLQRYLVSELNKAFDLSDTVFYVVIDGFANEWFMKTRIERVRMSEGQNAVILDLRNGKVYEITKNSTSGVSLCSIEYHRCENDSNNKTEHCSTAFNCFSTSKSDFFKALLCVNESERLELEEYQNLSNTE